MLEIHLAKCYYSFEKVEIAYIDIAKTTYMERKKYGMVIVFCILGLCVSFFLAGQFFEAAKAKGYNDKKYYWICFWLGLGGWLLVCALPDRGNSVPAISDELPEL